MKTKPLTRRRRGVSAPAVEVLEARISPASLASLDVAGNISVLGDQGATSEIETLIFTVNAGELHIVDPTHPITAGPGFIQSGANEVTIALTLFTGNLTVDTGTGADTLAFSSDLNLPGDGTLASGAITFNNSITLATDKTLTVSATDTISLPNTGSDLATSGAGAMSLTTLKNISLASGASITTVNGDLTLSANAAGTTTGNFSGVDVNAGLVQATGTGVVSVTGRGGDTGMRNVGVHVQAGGDIIGGTTGTTIVNGTGGPGNVIANEGIRLTDSGSSITSGGANVSVTGQAGGSGTAGSNYGVNVYLGALLSAGGSGNVTVMGTGAANLGSDNYGVNLQSSGSQITSSGGNVSVTGVSGGTGSGGAAAGISIDSGTVSAGGSGTVTVIGTGDLTSSGVNVNLGIDVRFTSTITSSGGNVQVTGAAGAANSSTLGEGAGIRVFGDSLITAGGSGTVTVSGTGGAGPTASAHGVFVSGSNLNSNLARIGAANGATTITATSGNTSSIALSVGTNNAGRITTGTNNPITITADSIDFGGSATISSGTGATTIQTRTSGTFINLGGADVLTGSPLTLGLTDAELDKVTASTLTIGDSSSGAITVSAALTHPNNLSLTTGGGVTFNQAVTMAVNKNLTVSALSTTTGAISLATTNSDLVASGTGAISLTTVANIALASGSSIAVVDGDLTLSANAASTGSFSAAGIDLNGGTITTSGTGNVSLTAKAPTNAGGIQVRGGAKILSTGAVLATQGKLTLNGRVTNGGTDVTVTGTGSEIKSLSGDISVTGGIDGGVAHTGILVSSSGSIESTGTAKITLNGYSRSATAVIIDTLGQVKSADGAIAIAGTLNDTPSKGITVQGGGKVQSTGLATITMDTYASAGGGSAGSHGITITGTGSEVTSVTAAIVLTGQPKAFSNNSYSVYILSGGKVASTSGDITLAGRDSSRTGNLAINYSSTVPISTSGTITLIGGGGSTGSGMSLTGGLISGTAGVTIRPGPGNAIDLGTAADNTNSLGLSDAELDIITTAGTLTIGDSASGAITVTAAISRPASTNVALTGGSSIIFNPGTLNTSGGTLALTPGASGSVQPITSGTEVTASSVSFESGADLAIAINGTTLDTQYRQLNVVGGVNLTGVDLVLSGSHVPVGGQTFTIVENDGTDAITGTFNGLAQGATITGFLGSALSATISYTGGSGNDVVLTAVAPPETDVSLSGGNLVVTDSNGGTSTDTITITLNGANVRITDPSNTVGAGAGATQIDANTVEVALASITGNIQVSTLGGDDTLTLALAGGDFIVAGGLTYAGGAAGTDKLMVTGGAQGTVTYNFTNANDGSVVLSNFGTVNFTGLEATTNSGSATDIVFNLPTTASTATLADDGTTSNGLSRLSAATFVTNDFSNPSGSLTLNRGNSADTLTINALPDFDASLTLSSGANPFSTLTFAGAVTLAASKTLSANASGTISLGAAGALTTSGTGAISLTGADVTGSGNLSADGGLTLTNTGTSSTLSGIISGVGALTKLGTGTQILTGTNTYTGTTTISGGSLQIGSGGTTGTLGTGSVINNANLTFDRSNFIGVNNAIGGTGSVFANGIGQTLYFGNANTYTGQTQVNAGRLVLGNSASLGSTAGGTVVAVGATLDLNGNGIAVGAEALTIQGAGAPGALAALQSNNVGNSSWAGVVTLAGATTIGGNQPGTTLTLGGIVTGAFALTKNGPNTLILSGANTYTGTTTISGGTLQVGNGGTTGTLGTGAVTNNSALVFNRSDSITIANNISGTGSLNVTAGGITASGVWNLGDDAILNSTAGITFNNAVTMAVNKGFTASASGTISLPNATSDIATSGTGIINMNGSTGVVLAAGSSLATVDGGIVVTSTSGGLNLNGTTLTTSGIGNVSLTGTGSLGTQLSNGAQVLSTATGLLANQGLLTLAGTGSGSSTGLVISSGSSVISVDGAISITGTGTAAGALTSIGIRVDASTVESTGPATITMVGRGSSGLNGGGHHGIFVTGGTAQITSVTGNISLDGQSGFGRGGDSHGVFVVSGADVTGTGSANVSILGVSPLTSGAGSNSNGIVISGAGSRITSANGTLALDGSGADEASSEGVVITAAGEVASTNGNIAVTGTVRVGGSNPTGAGIIYDSVTPLTTSGTITLISGTNIGARMILDNGAISGAAGVTLRAGNGIAIDLGSTLDTAANGLELSDAELDLITTAGTLQIGDSTSGTITVSAAITHANHLSLTTGAGVTFNQAVTMAANKNLTATANGTSNGTISLSSTNSDLTTGGTGAISLTTARDITLASGASVATVNGNLTLSANQQVTPTSGSFTGVFFNDAVVQATGSGAVTVLGKSGDGSFQQRGIYLFTGGNIIGGTSGTVTVQGTTGAATGTQADGIFLFGAGTTITSTGANVAVSGTGASTASSDNQGVYVSTGATITAGGSGTVTVTGISGAGSVSAGVRSIGGIITSAGGAVTVEGASSVLNAISLSGSGAEISSGGTAPLTLIGDSFSRGAPSIVRAGTAGDATVTFKPRTAGTFINLGGADVLTGSPKTLGLTDAELDAVSAATLQIGDANSGALTVSAAITHANDLSLTTGAGVTFNQAVTMAANKNFTASASGTIGFANTNADLATSGTGAIFLATARDISLVSGSSVATVDGNLTLRANLDGMTSGNFIGISSSGGTVQTTGAGVILISGIGGNSGAGTDGVRLSNSASVSGASVTITGFGGTSTARAYGVVVLSGATVTSSSGTVSVTGTGGAGTDHNYGVYVQDGGITSGGGGVNVTGTGSSAAGSFDNYGVYVEFSGQITAGGAGSVMVTGTGGGPTGGGFGVRVGYGGTITSSGGNVTVMGNGGTDGGGGNYGVGLDSSSGSTRITAGGTGLVSVTGIAGAGSSVGVFVEGNDSAITSSGGPVTVAGTGGMNVGTDLNHGIHLTSTGSMVTSGGGNVTLTGTKGTGANSFGIRLDGASVTTAVNGGNITFDATTVALGAPTTITTDRPAGTDGAIIFTGNIELGANLLSLNSGSTNSTIPGVISGTGGQLAKLGAGTLTLTAANTYTGTTTVSAGALNIRNGSALGSVAGGTTVAAGAALEIEAGITTLAEPLTLNGTGVGGTGALRNISGNNIYAGLITLGSITRINSDVGSNLTLSNPGTITGATFGLAVGGAGNTTIDSIIGTTTGTLNKDGAGILTLTAVSTYSGDTTVSGGTLALGVNNALPVTGVHVPTGATLQLNAFNQTVSSLDLNGGFVGGTGTLTSLSNLLLNGGQIAAILAGNINITANTGTTTLSNPANTFTGLVTVTSSMSVPSDGALGNLGNGLVIGANGTLIVTGTFSSARHITANGAAPSISVDATKTLTLTGLIDGTGVMQKTGAGKLLLGTTVMGNVSLTAGTPATTFGHETVSLTGTGSVVLTLVSDGAGGTRIGTMALSGTNAATVLTINGSGVPRTVIDHIISLNPNDEIGTIKLGPTVVLGDGLDDGIADIDIRGKVGKLLLNDISSYALIELGKGLPYDAPGNITPDSYNNRPDITLRNVGGPGVIIDVTGNGIAGEQPGSLGGGGLGKVVVSYWPDAGLIKTTQSIGSFLLSRGDCKIVFEVDKFHKGVLTTAGIGSMSVPKGAWASTGSIVEGETVTMTTAQFLAGANFTSGKLTTFTVNGDFLGSVTSEGAMRNVTIKGAFKGSLQAASVGKITAEYFDGTDLTNSDPFGDSSRRNINITGGALGLLTAKPHDLDTFGIKNYEIAVATSFGGITVTDKTAPGSFVAIDHVTVQAGSIGNTTVSITAPSTAKAIQNSVFESNGAMGTITTTHSITTSMFAAATNIAQVTVKGGLSSSKILAGTFLGDDAALGGVGSAADVFNKSYKIAGVKVLGAFVASTIAVGVDSVDGIYGNGNDVLASLGTAPGGATRAIGALIFGPGSGTVGASPSGAHTSAIEAASIKSLVVNGVAVSPLPAALPKYLDLGLAGEDSADVIVRILS
ncbi:MAG: autotransporter-associated beta strand repeat-containing protein [Chthoniobacteraceae bacterium]